VADAFTVGQACSLPEPARRDHLTQTILPSSGQVTSSGKPHHEAGEAEKSHNQSIGEGIHACQTAVNHRPESGPSC